MRFDDMLATVLAQPLDTPAARAIAWRQVVDLLGQRRVGADDPAGMRAYALLDRLRPEVPGDVRAEAARALSGRRLPPDLVAAFAEEPVTVMAPLIGSARLDDAEWLALLPALRPVARGLLRNRRDLSAAVVRALAAFGASDFVLGAPDHPVDLSAGEPAVVEPTPPEGEAQIRDLMARIEAFRSASQVREEVPPPEEVVAQCTHFRFETSSEGLILWVDGAPRGPLIGLSIAAAADSFDHGVDGYASGAFRQRAAFRDARLSVAGTGSVAGEWRISAVPFFDAADGRFSGYRGTARRPRTDETAVQAGGQTGLYGTGLAPDSLRQLVHELRTPLNAIVGFAEMIERQLLGPVAGGYRARAADIVREGRRLLAIVDDLDMSARAESQRLALDAGPVDATLLLARLQGDYERVAGPRGVFLDVSVDEAVPAVECDPVAVERMFARLLASTVGLAASGEHIAVRLDGPGEGEEPSVRLSVGRPAVLAERDERALLDPGYGPEGDWPDAPLLGLGFALRLVRNLAAAARGNLDIEPNRFVLSLPARANGALSGNHHL